METDKFCELIARLKGTSLKDITERDRQSLSKILNDESRTLDCAQFNELLLLVNKDRVSDAFFEVFFHSGNRISDIEKSVEHFQVCSMLAYGNFVFAYRLLSRLKSRSEIEAILNDLHIGGTLPGDSIFPAVQLNYATSTPLREMTPHSLDIYRPGLLLKRSEAD